MVEVAGGRLVTVVGGSGFVGRHVVQALAREGYRIRVAVRRPDLAGFLQPLGTVGQIHAVQANLRFPESVVAAVDGADAVVNLVGILHESGKQTFNAVQRDGAAIVARAAADVGAAMVQVSAIGADAASDADYARTKGEAEQAVLAAVPSAVILRPSIVFGPEDQFFNRFAELARFAPALPLIGGGLTKFQPVYVGDVAAAVAAALRGVAKPGTVYELGGPQVKTFRELMEYTLDLIERRRVLLPLPVGVAKLQAMVMQYLPGAPLTPDQVKMLGVDNVVSAAAIAEGRTLEGLGITPTAMDSVVPNYLWRFRKTGQFRPDKAA